MGLGYGRNSPTGVFYYSWWWNKANCVGEANGEDPLHDDIRTITADIAIHNSGTVMEFTIDPVLHYFPDRYYTLELTMRIAGDITTHTKIAQITVDEAAVTDAAGFDTYRHQLRTTGIAESSAPVPVTKEIYANDFHSNSYEKITLRFNKLGGPGKSLHITVTWDKIRTMYIDYFTIYDDYFNNLFLSSAATQAAVRANLSNQISTQLSSRKDRVKHYYLDEPIHNMYKAEATVSGLTETALGADKYLNGATAPLHEDMMMLIKEQRTPPYILYDLYPLNPGGNLQNALDSLIEEVSIDVGYGVRRKRGLRPAAQWANELGVPFYHTLQCQAENYITYTTADAVEKIEWVKRAPEREEIFVQGWLAVCYGAKGLMYYPLFTDVPMQSPPAGFGLNGKKWLATYGVFDDEANPYNRDNSAGIFQNLSNELTPNDRFYAIKDLNTGIDKISDELMQLTWIKSFSLHKENFVCNYISEVASYRQNSLDVSTWILEQPNQSYIELGCFKSTLHATDDNMEYFMLVNRRCLAEEQRRVYVTINKSGSAFTNWKITDVGTGSTWYVNKTGVFFAMLPPGEGKLFRLEPVMIAGGELSYNEVVSTPVNIGGPITVKPGVTLTLNAGAQLNFSKSSLFVDTQGVLVAHDAEIDFSSSPTDKYILVKGRAEIYGSTIRDASAGIYGSNAQKIDVRNCAFVNCKIGVLLNHMPGQNIYLYKNTITGAEAGIYCTNVSDASIVGNTINAKNGVMMYTTPNCYISYNSITGAANSTTGLLLNNSTGSVTGNTVTNFSRGVWSARS